MEVWQIQHIRNNFPFLVRETQCSEETLRRLQSAGLISAAEKQHVVERGAEALYQILQSRRNAFEILKDTLEATHQLPAFKKLAQCNGEQAWRKVGDIEYDKNAILGVDANNTKVFRGRMGQRESVAVKKVRCDKSTQELVVNETENLRKLNVHPNIVQFFHAEVDGAKRFVLFASELCSWTLEECVRQQQYQLEKIDILRQTTCGLEFLHLNEIIHRDLTPANVLIAIDDSRSARVKLADFGISRIIYDWRQNVTGTGLQGTRHWTPPEVLRNQVDDSNELLQNLMITFASDVFTLGCLFHYTLTDGQLPFKRGPFFEVNVLAGKHDMNKLRGMDNEAKFCPLIASMISTNPSMRPTCSDILKKLEDLQGTEQIATIRGIPERYKLDMIEKYTPFTVDVILPPKKLRHLDDYYKLPAHYKGQALIINVIEFDEGTGLNRRNGAVNDSIYMRDLWLGLGFQVTLKEGRLSKMDICKILTDFAEWIEEDDELKACVIYVGSHGEHGKIYTSDGFHMNTHTDIIYQITNLEVLRGKPKFFILNACQTFSRTEDDSANLSMKVEDTIICFSTLPGDTSKRDIYLGSWYVNCLTLVFMENAYKLDLESMLFLTADTMRHISTDETKVGQQPYHENFFMKKLYFNTKWNWSQ